MTSINFKNLVKIGQIKQEAFNQAEYEGLIQSGQRRLNDAFNESLSTESRFDLAYNAAHSFALAALRKHGFRSANRFTVFQLLPHTIGVGPEVWRILAKCHDHRNIAEYEGYFEIDEKLLNDLLTTTRVLQTKLP